jgi:nucleoside-diphosphate-sugar epimerase
VTLARGADFAGRRTLVTGAFGFLGGHLARHLVEAGANVTALDIDTDPARPCQLNLVPGLRERVAVVRTDVTDGPLLDRLLQTTRFDFVFHFATHATIVQRAQAAPLRAIESAAMGIVHLLDALRRNGASETFLLHASSDKVYGDAKGGAYSEATTPLDGHGVYEASKIAADLFARTYASTYGNRLVVVRMCNVFGPYDLDAMSHRLVPRSLASLFDTPRRRPQVYAGSRHHCRDYLHVDDCCRALLTLAGRAAEDDALRGRAFNVAGSNLGTEEMCAAIVDAAAAVVAREGDTEHAQQLRNEGYDVVGANGAGVVEIARQRCSGDLLREATGFTPMVDVRAGLEATADFYFRYLTGRLRMPDHPRSEDRSRG